MAKLEMLIQDLDVSTIENSDLKSYLDRLIAFIDGMESFQTSKTQRRDVTDPPPKKKPKKKVRPVEENASPEKFRKELEGIHISDETHLIQVNALILYAEELFDLQVNSL
ncbi:MAG: hypothetical protein AAGA10_12790 [Bacteroidota bacterium]